MEDTNENRATHLGMIQSVIDRMARNSFQMKSLSVTLALGLAALATATTRVEFAILAFFPLIASSVLDAYYLRQERLFRRLYDAVRTAAPGSLKGEMFSMDTRPYISKVRSLFATWRSHSVAVFHGAIIAAIAVAIVVSLW